MCGEVVQCVVAEEAGCVGADAAVDGGVGLVDDA